MSDLTIRYEGREIDPVKDFTLGEWEWLEDELGPLAEVDLQSIKARVRIFYLLRKRVEPAFTLEDAWELGLDALKTLDEDEPAVKRPRPTKPRAKKS